MATGGAARGWAPWGGKRKQVPCVQGTGPVGSGSSQFSAV